jgi:hypothetical protein
LAGIEVAPGYQEPSREVETVPHVTDQALVTRLGDKQLNVGVGDVSSEVLMAPRVVEPHHGRSQKSGTTQGEHVVRSVVEEDADMRRFVGIEATPEESGEALGFDEQIGVRPDLVAKAESGSGGGTGVVAVAHEQGSHVAGR